MIANVFALIRKLNRLPTNHNLAYLGKYLSLGGGVRNKPVAAYHKKLPLIPNSQKNDVLAQWGAIYAPHASLEKCQLSEFSSI